MVFKNIGKLLSIGILLNNFNLSSFAGVLSSDTRYETFEGDYISINDILEEQSTNVKISGNTIKNIVSENNRVEIKGAVTDYPPHNYIRKDIFLRHPLKANRTYTITLNVKSNGYNQPPFHSIVLGQGDVDVGQGLDSWSCRLYWNRDFKFKTNENNIGHYTVKFTTSSRIEETSFDNIKFIAHDWHNFDTVIEDICIFEGDWTENDPATYIDGMKSSFENDLVTQEMINNGQEESKNLGKYKVEVKSTGKNLAKPSYLENFTRDESNVKQTMRFATNKLYDVKPNTSYIFSTKQPTYTKYIIYLDKNLNPVRRDGVGTSSVSLHSTSPSNARYAQLYVFDSASSLDRNNEMINNEWLFEEGSTKTDYQPYVEYIKTFYLNSPLSKGDTIEIVNGQATHIKRSKYILFNGNNNEYWKYNYSTSNDRYLVFHIDYRIKPNSRVICDKFNNVHDDGEDYWSNPTHEGIMEYDNGNEIIVTINKSKLNTFNEEGFKVWLQSNPLKVLYELDNPIYEPINTELSIKLFDDTAHISNNSTIPVNMSIVVDRTLNRAIEAINVAQSNPTIDNISQARYWSNLLNDSSSKDYLQNAINSINNIDNIGNIEPINTSSNSDIYIKGKNTLSLSLDTNNIIFEDFDGIEDMELHKAINLTVSSSLPYDIKSTLATDISNQDKSITLSPVILNIKTSSANDYQTFTNINDDLLLISNETSGTNKLHTLDVMLNGGIINKADVYKTTIKLEVVQK